MDFGNKLIITCAVTGSIHIPTMSPHLPLTPDQISEEAIKAAEAGAAVVHIHGRDPKDARPTQDINIVRGIVKQIKEHSDVIICITTGGGMGMTVEERVKVIPELQPEMGSFNMGSMNFALHPALKKFNEFKYDWEPQYLEMSKDYIFKNTFKDLEYVATTFYENGVKPELECYDAGQLYNTAYLLATGILKPPVHLQFVMGILGGIGTHMDDLQYMKRTSDRLFGKNYSWSVIGAGRFEYPLCTAALLMDGHVRVGLEDNLYLDKGHLAKSNAELVEKMVRIAKDQGREPATPDETREHLGLRGKDSVKF